MYFPITNKSIPDETKVLIASSGFSLIGSPAKLKFVLITAPNPVINFISLNNLNNFVENLHQFFF